MNVSAQAANEAGSAELAVADAEKAFFKTFTPIPICLSRNIAFDLSVLNLFIDWKDNSKFSQKQLLVLLRQNRQ